MLHSTSDYRITAQRKAVFPNKHWYFSPLSSLDSSLLQGLSPSPPANQPHHITLGASRVGLQKTSAFISSRNAENAKTIGEGAASFQSPRGDKRLSPRKGKKAVRGVVAEMAFGGKLYSYLGYHSRADGTIAQLRVRMEGVECQERRQRSFGT